MKFKIGDYLAGQGITFHINSKYKLSIVNANPTQFRYATQAEIKQYHEDINNDS